MATHEKDGKRLGNFSEIREKQGKYALPILGKFLTNYMGFAPSTRNDLHKNGDIDWRKPDVKALSKDGLLYRIEGETKNVKGFTLAQTSGNLHTLWRKKKFLSNLDGVPRSRYMHFTARMDGLALFCIPPAIIELAYSHPGLGGFGRIPPSPDFVMPSHGCYQFDKWCIQDDDKTYEIESFINVPIKYLPFFTYNPATDLFTCVANADKFFWHPDDGIEFLG